MFFWYISHVYLKTHLPYILHEMHSFASVLMCFICVFTAETCNFNTFQMYTKIQIYHIFYMKCTVLLVFSCVFTVFLLQKHVLLVHFTCIPKYTCTIYSTWNEQLCLYFNVFSLQKHILLVHFTCIPKYTYTIYSTWNAQFCWLFSYVFTVFLLQKHVVLVHFTCLYQNTHVPYILHEMHSFAFCFHVFLLCFYWRNM
jgi:hypothetical protein